MELWLQGVLWLLQGGVTVVLPVWLQRLQDLAAGTLIGLLLCGFLPQAERMCSTLVLAPALTLGVILAIFLRESTPRHRRCILGGWLMLCSFLQTKGILSTFSLPYLLPAGIALREEKLHAGDLMLAGAVLAGLAAGHFYAMPSKWQGLLISLFCGALLQSIGITQTKLFAGGVAIGVILSFI